ncbi:hypothetical protein CDD83_3792 [Cordyceps sp. RAO-2017]|nr:hypothetical protein CDD83_3792 [Cordyceps sp. RAO-2017]
MTSASALETSSAASSAERITLVFSVVHVTPNRSPRHMEEGNKSDNQNDESTTGSTSHRRAPSGSSLLSRLPFMRVSAECRPCQEPDYEELSSPPPSAVPVTIQHHKTRRRRGSLRKVALLGRGGQRDKRDERLLTSHILQITESAPDNSAYSGACVAGHDALGLKIVRQPQQSQDHSLPFQNTSMNPPQALSTMARGGSGSCTERDGERFHLYTSTTDEEDLLHMSPAALPPRTSLSMSSGSESYFGTRGSTDLPRSFKQAKSPLSYSGIPTNPIPPADSDWDYSETEWWGWVVLTVTWFVFVMGMGSCLDVWSWAWDVGKTPYAPPELEDDPTLPIVGYYPALIIMTGVMAWVWVVVAWVGMKYFRHAKISGD